jgi:uncharacterized protein
MISRALPWIAALALVWLATPAQAMPRIAIIIDDLGNQPVEGRRAVDLPGPVAMAFLPHTPNGRQLAVRAHAAGKEVMLHLPLQALNGDELGPGAITLDTTEEAFRRILRANLESVPHVRGVNTHMGSLLTRHPGHMSWLMDEIVAIGGLFFVDSYTALESVALQMAAEAGVPALRREVFLDSDPDPDAIRYQFMRLVRLAQEQGQSVGIGHPYPATMDVLEDLLLRLDEFGVELVPVEALLR